MRHLTEAEMAPLKEHLLKCEECRNRLALMDFDIAAIREALKQWREEKIQQPSSRVTAFSQRSPEQESSHISTSPCL